MAERPAELKRLRRALWWQARLLPLLAAGRPLPRILDLASPAPGERYCGIAPATVLAEVVRATRRPWLMRRRRCLRQGLLACRFLSAAGARPELHFGVAPGALAQPRLEAHCWVVVDGVPVLNGPDPPMTTLLIHGASPWPAQPGTRA